MLLYSQTPLLRPPGAPDHSRWPSISAFTQRTRSRASSGKRRSYCATEASSPIRRTRVMRWVASWATSARRSAFGKSAASATAHHLTLVCRDLADAGRFTRLDNWQFRIVRQGIPGAYTFLLPGTREVPRQLLHPKRSTIGLRVPDHPVVHALLAELGEPILSSTLILPGRERAAERSGDHPRSSRKGDRLGHRCRSVHGDAHDGGRSRRPAAGRRAAGRGGFGAPRDPAAMSATADRHAGWPGLG